MKFFKPHNLIHSEFIIEVDGVKYSIHTMNYHVNQGYARCMIEDTSTKNRYYVHDRIELNGHVFYFSWDEKFDFSRLNYIPGKDMTIYVDEIPEFDPQSITIPIRNNSQNINLIIS